MDTEREQQEIGWYCPRCLLGFDHNGVSKSDVEREWHLNFKEGKKPPACPKCQRRLKPTTEEKAMALSDHWFKDEAKREGLQELWKSSQKLGKERGTKILPAKLPATKARIFPYLCPKCGPRPRGEVFRSTVIENGYKNQSPGVMGFVAVKVPCFRCMKCDARVDEDNTPEKEEHWRLHSPRGVAKTPKGQPFHCSCGGSRYRQKSTGDFVCVDCSALFADPDLFSSVHKKARKK